MKTGKFFDFSKAIAEDYLQTAVLLDDMAVFPESTKISKKICNPVTRETEMAKSVLSEDAPDTAASSAELEPDGRAHDLDAKTVTDAFMKKGVICSIIKCDKNTFDSQKDSYIDLMKKADIVVLDWSLFKDGGQKITEIIGRLIETDKKLKELRSIIIYTAAELTEVKKELKKIDVIFEDSEYVSNNNSYTAVSLFNKESITAVDERKVDFNHLVDKCIDEFTSAFYGIIPNVAMAAISEVRKNTHKILGVLNKDLDIAYLSHRALLPFPEDAEYHLEEIIADEIESIIHENKVGGKASYDNIKEYDVIKNKRYQGICFSDCIEKGIDNIILESKTQLKNDVKECFTQKWCCSTDNEPKISENKFAMITSMITDYAHGKKYLNLGVIIESQEDKKQKFLCLQPDCDSIRIENTTDFLFIELTEDAEYFGIIVKNGEEFKKCKVAFGKKYRKSISFNDSGKGTVESDDNYEFKDADGKLYKYIGALKKLHAQKIMNDYSAYISRVGLNESEYLRRNRTKR
jgi:hypothetical protein